MSNFGPIIDQERLTTQYDSRDAAITRFIWHHQAGTSDDTTINMMVNHTKQLSATYTVNNDNYGGRGWSRITGVAPERFRPWTSGSFADEGALTAEVCNSSGGPQWGIADATHEACARIAAYAHQAYGIQLQRATNRNMSGHMGHNEVVNIFGEGYSTACPGNLNINWIIARARQMLGQGMPGWVPPGVNVPIASPSPAENVGFNNWDGVHFNLAPGHYYGDINGPAESHGGAFKEEWPPITKLQRRLQTLKYAPAGSGWADGLYESPTVDSVAAWQHANMPDTEFYGQVWGDDWQKLFSDSNVPGGGGTPAPVPPPAASGGGRPWPAYMPHNEWFGDINGPAQSHGGYYASERPDVMAIQERLNAKGYNAGYPDGLFEQPTIDGATRFQQAELPHSTQYYGQIWQDDWAQLFS